MKILDDFYTETEEEMRNKYFKTITVIILICLTLALTGCITNNSVQELKDTPNIVSNSTPEITSSMPDGYDIDGDFVYPSQLPQEEIYMTATNGKTLDAYGTWDKIEEKQSGADKDEDNFKKYYMLDSSLQYHMLIDIFNNDTCVIQYPGLDENVYVKDEFKYMVDGNKIIGFVIAGYVWELEDVDNDNATFSVIAIDNSDDQYGDNFKRVITLRKLPKAQVHVYTEYTQDTTTEAALLEQMVWIEIAQFDKNDIFDGIVLGDGAPIMEGMPIFMPEQIAKIEYTGNVKMNIYDAKGDSPNLAGESGNALLYSGDVKDLPTEGGDYIICFRLYDDSASGRSHRRLYFILMTPYR